MLFESAFVSAARFGGTKSEWLSLSSSNNGATSFCLVSRYSPQDDSFHHQTLIQSLSTAYPSPTIPKKKKKNTKKQHVFAETHCSVAASLQTLLRICFPLMPLFLPSICTMQRGVHVTQFVFSSLSTESRETAQSRSTQRNCSSTVSLFAEMRLLIALFSL